MTAEVQILKPPGPVEIPGHDPAALVHFQGGLPSIERMRERMAFQKDMRAMLVEYVKSKMDPGRHFYTIPGSSKPALSQDGARMLCTLYEVHAEDTLFVEDWEPDGHYIVRATVRLRSMATGQVVAEGTGRCSTRESKYAYRWMWDNELPGTARKADLERRQRGKSWQYKVPNPDLADTYNTVLKIAEKRGQTAAVLRLPCAPDVFSEPGVEEEEREKEEAADRKELIGLIVKWAKTLPAGTRNRAFEAIWGTPYEKIAGLSLTALDTGYGWAEQATVAQVDWKSKTLKADLAALQADSAQKAKADLFGDDPRGSTPVTTPDEAGTSEEPVGTPEAVLALNTLHAEHGRDVAWIQRYWERQFRRFQVPDLTALTAAVRLQSLYDEAVQSYATPPAQDTPSNVAEPGKAASTTSSTPPHSPQSTKSNVGHPRAPQEGFAWDTLRAHQDNARVPATLLTEVQQALQEGLSDSAALALADQVLQWSDRVPDEKDEGEV